MKPFDASLYRELTPQEAIQLESQGCFCENWTQIKITSATDLTKLRNTNFYGSMYIGKDVRIENVDRLQFNPNATFGVGTRVNVLDETGKNSVVIYPGMSAQVALLQARAEEWREKKGSSALEDCINSRILPPLIGDGSTIRNCNTIIDTYIGERITIDGAGRLKNGCVINNSKGRHGLASIGFGVDAENFIIEDASVGSSSIIRNCYVGQGCIIDKGFTAHDSLFFANSTMENGEGVALFSGPYSVSMHKSTLLIGCQTSFMNAGSGTNQSNHMYKMGPIHWGILERGVKTSSDSYLMLGAKIGAFSLLMGQHKTHPDSSEFPFSYLFGDDRGSTVVVPAAMLRSCGLLRDQKKWISRDRRKAYDIPLQDRITHDVLNPATVDSILKAMETIERLLQIPADDDRYLRYKGMKLTRASLERARHIYELAVFKYLHIHSESSIKSTLSDSEAEDWVDLAGQLITRSTLDEIMQQESLEEIEGILDEAFSRYEDDQLKWISNRFKEEWKFSKDTISKKAEEFDAMVEEDKRKYEIELERENKMLKL